MSIDFFALLMATFIISLIIVAYLYTGYRISERIIHPKAYNYDEVVEIEKKYASEELDSFEKLNKEEVEVISEKGLKIHCVFIPEDESKKTIVLIHGFAYNLMGAIKYIGIFKRLGFNILIFDNQYHGKSGGDMVSFGFYEKYDLKNIIDWIKIRIPDSELIGTHGESMGAAVAIEHAAMDKRVSFVIADCPYSGWKEIIDYQLKRRFRFLSVILLPVVNLWIKLRAGIAFADVNLLKSVKIIDAPILFFHGENDTYTPNKMTEALYKNKKGAKKLFIVPGARHAESYIVDKEKYESLIIDFLKENGLSSEIV